MSKLSVVQLTESSFRQVSSLKRIAPNLVDQNSNEPRGLGDSDNETVASHEENQHQKRKRQRLTHLTEAEKLERRKLKNRVAAQGARDRKKRDVDDLVLTVEKLKKENAKLLKENSLLKTNTQLLIDENRKLLKFKTDTEAQTVLLPLPIVAQSPLTDPIVKDELIVCNTNSMKQSHGADESAVFTKYASQQKRQLQGVFQRMIYMLLLQTLGLLKQEMSHAKPVAHKMTKLRSNLEKLYKMANARKMLQKPSDSIRIMNTYRIAKSSRSKISPLNLAMIISVIVKAFEMKKKYH